MYVQSGAMRRYEDIIDLPHHVSAVRPRMPMSDRAAQFSPFAALTGYEAVIREAGRLTQARIELDECGKALLDGKLHLLLAHLDERPEVTLTYFQPDEKKAGGAYIQVAGRVRKIDAYARTVVLTDGTAVPLRQIYDIESELFDRAGFV